MVIKVVTGNIRDIGKYSALGQRLRTAFDAAEKLMEKEPPASGSYPIDGKNVYVNVQRYQTVPPDSKKYEAHRRYLDIQLVAQGHETVEYSRIDRLRAATEYQQADDYELLEGEGSPLHLAPGDFMLLYPEDAHKPGCIDKEPENVVKYVIKVLI